MLVRIDQKITLRFGAPTSHVVQHVLLTPTDSAMQTVRSWSVTGPGMDKAARYDDAYGNIAHLCNQTEACEVLEFSVSGEVETSGNNGVVGRLPADPQPGVFLRMTPDTRSPVTVHGPFRHMSIDGQGRLEVLHGLMARVHQMTTAAQDEHPASSEARDFAESFVAGARALGVPARFVRGYLASGDGAEPIEGHAWAEAWDDGLGWVGFDAAHNLCPAENHVRVAAGLDAASTLAIRCHPAAQAEKVSLNGVDIAVAVQRQQ